MPAWTSCWAMSMDSARENSRVMTDPPPELVEVIWLESGDLAELPFEGAW
jgi:hypothetical protein